MLTWGLNPMTKINTNLYIFPFLALLALSLGSSAHAQSAPSLSGETVSVTGPHNIRIYVTVNPNGSPTDVSFRYKTGSTTLPDSTYGNITSPTTTQNWGLVNLLEGTTYSYQIIARNGYGTVIGSSGTFTTPGNTSSGGSTTTYNSGSTSNNNSNTSYNSSNSQGVPSVFTNGPVSVSTNSAVINGTVNPNGNPTNFWFEFGTDQSLGQNTTTQSVGSGTAGELVTGNLSNLTNNRTYYYRVVAQNSYGRSVGDIRSFTTGTSQTNGTGTGQSGSGQVLGAVSGSGTGNTTGTGTSTGTGTTAGNGSSTSSGTSKTTSTTRTSIPPKNLRPSFISLEYSLDNNGALVLVADNLKPRPGEEFSYTVVYNNNTDYAFNEAELKVLLPSEVDFVSASIEPVRISGAVVEFKLGTIAPFTQNATVVTVKVKETVKPGTNLIFTTVLGYKDRSGTQLATTSYMTVKVGQLESGSSFSALSIGSIASSTGALVLVAVGLLVLMSLLTYRFVKIRNGKTKKPEEKDPFGKGVVPPTFEPIDIDMSYRG